METQIKKLIKALENNPDIEGLDFYNPENDDYWDFYYHIIGFYNDNYFSLSIRKNHFTHVEIAKKVTDNIKELNIYLDSLTELKFTIN